MIENIAAILVVSAVFGTVALIVYIIANETVRWLYG